MKLIVISPEAADPRELSAMAGFFADGLDCYHVRKPAWPRVELAAWLRRVPVDLHLHLILHTHHDLANEFGIGGVHERDDSEGRERVGGVLSTLFRSRAAHDLPALRAALGCVDRVVLSPVFPSFSKPGHTSAGRLPHSVIATLLATRPAAERRTEVVALGGVDRTRLAACRALGFDGVAVFGAIWQAADPVAVFHDLKNQIVRDAA